MLCLSGGRRDLLDGNRDECLIGNPCYQNAVFWPLPGLMPGPEKRCLPLTVRPVFNVSRGMALRQVYFLDAIDELVAEPSLAT